jgi:gliding motility-associated-like protein
MRRNVTLVLILFLCISTSSVKAQFNLIVNELSQGTNGSKEFVELLVVGTRTCTDSTADLRNWIFDDHNGWYAGAGSGIAAGHYRFSNSTNWEKVPYGSIILIYNNADRNTKIPAGTDDPTDANKDYKYQLPITNALIQQNDATPVTPSSPSYTYPTTGYGTSSDWVSIGLANSGDGIVIVNPANRGVAHFSIVFGLGAGGGAFQVPTVQKPNVDGGSNLYLSNDLYTNAASWIIGDAGTADETPGTPNTTANATWINNMRVQASLPGSVSGNITQPTCATPTGTITVTGPTGTGYTYSIDGTTFQASPVFAGLAPGSYTITVRNATGCSVTATITINPVPGAPAAPTFTLTQPTCTTPTGTITITAPTGAGLTYSINGTTFQAGTTFTGVTPGTYTVTVRNAAGCNSTANAVINAVPGAPAAATVTVTQPTCTIPTGTINITAPTGTGLEYSINGTTFQTTTTFAGLAPNAYTITVRNAAGCTSTTTATVNAVPSAPAAATVTVTQPTCTTPTGTITITAPIGTGLEYSINGTTFQTTTTFAGLAPNAYTITVRNAAGCTSTTTATVNAVPSAPPAATVTVTQPTCTTPTGTITITAPTGTGLEYSINGTTFQTTTTFAGLAPNTYTITVRNAAGCTSTATATVNAVPASPAAATATVTQPTCSTPTGTITITAPTGTGLEYSINGTTFQTTTSFAGLAPNTYTITVRNAAGCTSTATATVNAVPASPSAPVVTTPVTYCLNATAVALTATGTNLLWYTAASGGTGSGTAPVPATNAAGSINYYVSQSNGGCESPRAMITITVTDINVAAITGNTSICAAGANSTTLANTTTGGTWSSSNTAVATVSNAGVVTGLSAGTTTISYSVTSGSCTKAVTTVVTVNDFTLNLTSSATTVPQGNAFTLSTSAATNYQVTAWLPLAIFTNQAALTQTLIASANATYSAVALSTAGCIDTASITITVSAPEKHEVFVPNVFSPNGDGKNDILKVYSTTLKSMEFSIFNQWGEMIFRTTNINGGWDGTAKGKLQPGTVYIYVLKAVMVDNSIINKKGSVTLLR